MAPPLDTLARWAATAGDKVAVIDDHEGQPRREWTFATLNARVNQLARHLASVAGGPGAAVVTCGPNSAGLLLATHAVRKAGLVLVPLNYRLTAPEAVYVVDNSDATVAFVDAEYAPLFEQVQAAVPALRHVLVFDGDGELEATLDGYPSSEPDLPGPATAATMLYTSGTTGQPKGALRGLPDAGRLGALIELLGLGGDEVYVTTGPLYHSGPASFAGIVHRLGGTVVVQRRFEAEDWLRLVHRYGVTTTFSAPTPLRMVLDLPPEVKGRYDASTMRCFVANAAPWSQALKRRYLAEFPADSLWEVYGSTELGVTTALAPADQLRKPGSCGRVVPGVEVMLVDANGEEVHEPGVPGELFVKAANLFDTYHKAHDRFEEGRRGAYHSVGDIAYRDAEGYVYIADRKSDMIITGGMNVYPAEVESALEACPAVGEVAVFGVPDEQWGERVHAVVVSPAPTGDAEAVMAYARTHLASYKRPRSVSFAAELPKTGSGKVLKRQLRDALLADTGDLAP